MNPYLKNLQKIEFVLCANCSGHCKHCSQGDHPASAGCLDPDVAVKTIGEVSALAQIKTVMVFGGEPLLYPEATAQIIAAARDARIPHRQIITNGFFSHSQKKIYTVVQKLSESGVNDLLLSVDAFHQETIPMETVRDFALAAKDAGIPLRLQPAWLVSPTHENPYNIKTRFILDLFKKDGFPESDGNVIFPEGNAKKYLSEYFTETVPKNPYAENPEDIRTLSIDSDGSVLGGNLYKKSILEIMEEYQA